MLEWLFGGTFFLSMISGISSIPFILSLLIYNKINPISFKNWKSYFIHIHIIATLLNMFILVVLFNFSGNGNIEWLPVAYMILGIFTWFISIRKESKRQENKTIYPHLN
jgi:phosphatidylserine synthase